MAAILSRLNVLSHCNSFKDQAPVRVPDLQWIAEAWLHDRVPEL